jgi:hypothetical protein
MEINNVFDQIRSFDRWKLYTEIVDPTNIGNLFVALATEGGIPKKTIAGKVIAEPLLASVFINPLRNPQNKKRNTAEISTVVI